MGEERWFCRGDEEWVAIGERLKQTRCPHCKVFGTLIRHGFLYGRDETSPNKETRRAQRVFCSNRNARHGCGRTFSVWLADKIRRLSLTTAALWLFLQQAIALASSPPAAPLDFGLTDRTWQRIWKRFDQGQSKIRTALYGRCPPPDSPPGRRRTRANRPRKSSPISRPPSPTPTVLSPTSNIRCRPSLCNLRSLTFPSRPFGDSGTTRSLG